jgi:hypothetical protein
MSARVYTGMVMIKIILLLVLPLPGVALIPLVCLSFFTLGKYLKSTVTGF